MKRLEGVSALISGGASGVGRATAHRFAQEGAARITLFDKDAERIADNVRDLLPDGKDPIIASIGPAVGAHAGPGSIGIGVLRAST